MHQGRCIVVGWCCCHRAIWRLTAPPTIPQEQHEVLKAFQEGRYAVLVATAVAEEGLDLRQCHLVLRYDLPATPKSFIQSRGRARVRRSSMVLLVRRGDWRDTEKVTRALEYAPLHTP
jgi:ERCC4-related helicase